MRISIIQAKMIIRWCIIIKEPGVLHDLSLPHRYAYMFVQDKPVLLAAEYELVVVTMGDVFDVWGQEPVVVISVG